MTALHHGNYKFIECDVYNKRVIVYSEDGQMKYFSTTDHTNILDLPRVDNIIIQLVVSKYGIIYVMNDNFQVFMHVEGKYKRVGPKTILFDEYFNIDIIDDEYIIGLASDGRVHQYPILQGIWITYWVALLLTEFIVFISHIKKKEICNVSLEIITMVICSSY